MSRCRPICRPIPPSTPAITAGDMTAGNVSPDFQTTINAYDSQGGIQPITLSFVKTGANHLGL